VIDRSEAVVENDTMRGIHVWYHIKALDRRPNSDQPPREPYSIPILIHGEVARRLPAEYIEAVVDEALDIFSELEDYRGVLFAISPRRIAVIVDGQSFRVIVIPVELVEEAAEGSTKRQLETWLAAPRSRFYLMHIARSRFEDG
jgi:hypothetical protein